MEFDYLQRQKESIDKVDQLIEEAEQSLQELRREFYETGQEAAKAASQQSSGQGQIPDVRVSKDSTETRSLKSDRHSGLSLPVSAASKETAGKRSIKSSSTSLQPPDVQSSKHSSGRSSIVKSDRISFVEQPVGAVVDLTGSKDTARRLSKSERGSLAQKQVGGVSRSASKDTTGGKSIKSKYPSVQQQSIRSAVDSRHSKDSTGRISIKSDHGASQRQSLTSATKAAVSKDTTQKLVTSDHTSIAQPTAVAADIGDSRAHIRGETVASATASKDSIRKTLAQSVPRPISVIGSTTVSKETADKRSIETDTIPSAQQPMGLAVSRNNTVEGSIESSSKGNTSKGPTTSECLSLQQQLISHISKDSGGRKSAPSERSSDKHEPRGTATDVTASKASTFASQRTGSTVTSDKKLFQQQAVIDTSYTVSQSNDSTARESLQQNPINIITSTATATENNNRQSFQQELTNAIADASTLNERRSISSRTADIPSKRSSRASRRSTSSKKSSRISATTDPITTSSDNENTGHPDVNIDESIKIKVYSKEATESSENSDPHSRYSILKPTVTRVEEEVDVIKPTPLDENRFVSTKNSIFLKMVSGTDLSDDEEGEPVDDGSRIVKIVEDPPLGEFHSSGSIILRAQEVNMAVSVAVEEEDSVTKFSSLQGNDEKRVSNLDSGTGLVSQLDGLIETAGELPVDHKHGVRKECCPCDKNEKKRQESDNNTELVSRTSSRSRSRELDVARKGSVSAKPSLEPIPDWMEKSSTSEKLFDERPQESDEKKCDKESCRDKSCGPSKNDNLETFDEQVEKGSKTSRDGSYNSLTNSLEPVADTQAERASKTSSKSKSYDSLEKSAGSVKSGGSIKTPASDEQAQGGNKTSREDSLDGMRKPSDSLKGRGSGKSSESIVDIEEDMKTKKSTSDKDGSRKSRNRSYMKKTARNDAKSDELSVFDKCPEEGNEKKCDKGTCRDRSCGPSKKGSSPARSPPAKSHVIPCNVPCRGEVYMQSLSPKSARELKTKQAGKKKKKTSGDRSRQLDSARKRSEEKFDGDDEDTSVEEKPSKRSNSGKASPTINTQTEEAQPIKNCCLSNNHQSCCLCSKAATSEASVTASSREEMLMLAPTTPDSEFELPKPTSYPEAVSTPDPTPTAPNVTTSMTELSNNNEEDESCSCEAELEALKNSRPFEPCGNAMKLISVLKSPLSPKKPSSVCKRTAFCTECQMIPPPEPEFISEVSRIARTAGIFEPQPVETTSTETDTDESCLMTISEKTEDTSVIPLESKQLTIQHLPQIDIRPPLVVQKVFEIEIKSTGSVNMQIPAVHNICYEEVLHAETSVEELPAVILDEFVKDREDYKVVTEENSVKLIEPNISIKDTKSITFQEERITTSEDGEKKSCLKDYDSEKPIIMKTIKSNVSFKHDSPKTLDFEESKSGSIKDDKSESQEVEIKSTDTEDTVESEMKKEDEKPTKPEIEKQSSVTIKDIKQVTLKHPDSTLMLVSPVQSASNTHFPVKVSRSKNYIDVIELEVNNEPSKNEVTKKCGCNKEGGSQISDELEMDETLDTVCDCSDAPLKELMGGSDLSLETKKSLHDIRHMETVLNKLISDKALAEPNLKDDYKLLDSHEYEEEDGTEKEGAGAEDNIEEEGDKQDPEVTNIQQVFQSDSKNDIYNSKKSEEKLPIEETTDKPNEEPTAKEKPKLAECPSNNPSESKAEEKSVKSEKGTPLFTEDPNYPDNNKGVPKSVSQYFSSTNVSLADEDEGENANDSQPPRLSILSNSIKQPVTSLQSSETPNDPVDGALQILQVEPGDQGRAVEKCDCPCRNQQQTPMTLMVSAQSTSNPISPKTSSRSSKGSKNLQPTTSSASSTRSNPTKSRKVEKAPSDTSSISLQPVYASDGTSLNPSIRRSKNRGDPNAKYSSSPSNVARKTSFNLADRVVLPGKESLEKPQNTESEESIYVLTHDVSLQVSLESLTPARCGSSASRGDKKLPRVKISVQDSNANDERLSNNYSKRKHKVTSKDQYQQSQHSAGESQDEGDANSTDTQETERDENDSPPQTVILQPVIVHYETKGVQKSLEDWRYPPVKLHKLRTCDDLETSSTNDTDADMSSLKNAPFGDMPTASEFISCPIKRTDMPREDDELTSLPECRNLKMFKSPKHCYSTSSSETIESRLEETLSEGEIKCRCSVSIGELHICRLAKDIKTRAAYLKKHPEALVKHEYPGEDVRLLKQRIFYDNWVAIYASKITPTTTSSTSDTGDRSTDT